MTAIAIIANVLFAAFVLTAIVGSHLRAISSSRVRHGMPARPASAGATKRLAPARRLAEAR